MFLVVVLRRGSFAAFLDPKCCVIRRLIRRKHSESSSGGYHYSRCGEAGMGRMDERMASRQERDRERYGECAAPAWLGGAAI